MPNCLASVNWLWVGVVIYLALGPILAPGIANQWRSLHEPGYRYEPFRVWGLVDFLALVGWPVLVYLLYRELWYLVVTSRITRLAREKQNAPLDTDGDAS